eukprot:370548-Pyramimonas_sp.AAC.2
MPLRRVCVYGTESGGHNVEGESASYDFGVGKCLFACLIGLHLHTFHWPFMLDGWIPSCPTMLHPRFSSNYHPSTG